MKVQLPNGRWVTLISDDLAIAQVIRSVEQGLAPPEGCVDAMAELLEITGPIASELSAWSMAIYSISPSTMYDPERTFFSIPERWWDPGEAPETGEVGVSPWDEPEWSGIVDQFHGQLAGPVNLGSTLERVRSLSLMIAAGNCRVESGGSLAVIAGLLGLIGGGYYLWRKYR